MLKACAVCCILLSLWAIIQLLFMGLFFKLESVLLIQDARAQKYEDYEDFLKITKSNYAAIGTNCLIASGVYIVFLAISCVCLKKAKSDEKMREALLADDNAALELAVKEHELTEKEKQHIK